MPPPLPAQALCVCPTRELVVQNQMVLERMGKFTGGTGWFGRGRARRRGGGRPSTVWRCCCGGVGGGACGVWGGDGVVGCFGGDGAGGQASRACPGRRLFAFHPSPCPTPPLEPDVDWRSGACGGSSGKSLHLLHVPLRTSPAGITCTSTAAADYAVSRRTRISDQVGGVVVVVVCVCVKQKRERVCVCRFVGAWRRVCECVCVVVVVGGGGGWGGGSGYLSVFSPHPQPPVATLPFLPWLPIAPLPYLTYPPPVPGPLPPTCPRPPPPHTHARSSSAPTASCATGCRSGCWMCAPSQSWYLTRQTRCSRCGLRALAAWGSPAQCGYGWWEEGVLKVVAGVCRPPGWCVVWAR